MPRGGAEDLLLQGTFVGFRSRLKVLGELGWERGLGRAGKQRGQRQPPVGEGEPGWQTPKRTLRHIP